MGITEGGCSWCLSRGAGILSRIETKTHLHKESAGLMAPPLLLGPLNFNVEQVKESSIVSVSQEKLLPGKRKLPGSFI